MQITGMESIIGNPPVTNWGGFSPDGLQPPQPNASTNDVLAYASLSDEDCELLALFELGTIATEQPGELPALQSAFSQLMFQAGTGKGNPRVFQEWVELFVRFIPEYNPSWTAEQYCAAGYAYPLAAFYIVASRSGFWNQRLSTIKPYGLVMTDMLCPDPTELRFNHMGWDEGDFTLRYVELKRGRGLPKEDVSRQLIMQLEVLIQVLGTVLPPVKKFLNAYDEWAKKLPQ